MEQHTSQRDPANGSTHRDRDPAGRKRGARRALSLGLQGPGHGVFRSPSLRPRRRHSAHRLECLGPPPAPRAVRQAVRRGARADRHVLLVDMSGSADFGTGGVTKRRLLAQVGALLAFSAIKNQRPGGSDLVHRRGRAIRPAPQGTQPRAAGYSGDRRVPTPSGRARTSARRSASWAACKKRRAVCFVLSDFFDYGFDDPLKLTMARHDVVALRVVDPAERILPDLGPRRTGRRRDPTSLTSSTHRMPEFAQAYEQSRARADAEAQRRLRQLGCDTVRAEHRRGFRRAAGGLLPRRAPRGCEGDDELVLYCTAVARRLARRFIDSRVPATWAQTRVTAANTGLSVDRAIGPRRRAGDGRRAHAVQRDHRGAASARGHRIAAGDGRRRRQPRRARRSPPPRAKHRRLRRDRHLHPSGHGPGDRRPHHCADSARHWIDRRRDEAPRDLRRSPKYSATKTTKSSEALAEAAATASVSPQSISGAVEQLATKAERSAEEQSRRRGHHGSRTRAFLRRSGSSSSSRCSATRGTGRGEVTSRSTRARAASRAAACRPTKWRLAALAALRQGSLPQQGGFQDFLHRAVGHRAPLRGRPLRLRVARADLRRADGAPSPCARPPASTTACCSTC